MTSESKTSSHTPKQLLVLIHGWLGAISSLFILIIAVTGIGLAFFGELFELQYGEMLYAEPAPYTDLSKILNAAEAGHGNNFSAFGMFMPDTRVENLETALVYGAADNAETGIMMVSVDAATAQYKGSFELHHAFAHEFNDFHFSLLMGDGMKVFMAIIGLLLIAFAMSGIYMWWPKRNAWRKATKLQTKGKLLSLFYNWHGLAGIWLSLFIIYFSLTGTALSQSDWFSSVLATMEDPIEWEEKFKQDCGEVIELDDAASMALGAFPDKQISSVSFVKGEMQKYVFTLKGENDIDRRMGDAMAQVHSSCSDLMYTTSLSKEPLSVKIGNQMLSLHGGHIFRSFSVVFNLVAGMTLVLLSVSGIVVFFKSTLPASNRRRLKNNAKKVIDSEC